LSEEGFGPYCRQLLLFEDVVDDGGVGGVSCEEKEEKDTNFYNLLLGTHFNK
jgi:hypothetical protein